MTSKKEPDFAACYDLANEILIASTVIEAFPFSIKRVISPDYSKMGKFIKFTPGGNRK